MYAHAGHTGMANEFQHLNRVRDEHADASERTYALFNHLVGFASIGSGGIPFLGLIGAIIMWRIKAKESPFLEDHGREAVNFQLSLLAYTIIGIPLSIVTFGILAIPWYLAVLALSLVGQIRGAMAANRGEFYRYPACFRFFREPLEGDQQPVA